MKIYQEISILDHLLVAASGVQATSNEIVNWDDDNYNGADTRFYFEIVAWSDVSLAFDVKLVAAIDGAVATINVPTSTTVPTLFRSASFDFDLVARNYTVLISNTVGTNKNVKSAKIIIIQDAATLTNTETQVEIGNYNLARTTETAAILVNPKYWKYTAANWDGTKTFYAEVVYDSGDMDTISAYIYEAPDITAPVWTVNASIVTSATTTVPTRTRVAFTPVDGRWYTIFSQNGSMDNHDIYRAGIVVQQADSPTKLEPQYLLANTLFAGGTALQTFLTDWDSTEWSGVTNTYYFQAEAANDSTSDVTLEQADGGGTVTNSTLTNIDNAQISTALTMPASENLDTKATTNAGDVAAARILVACVVSAETPYNPTVTRTTRGIIGPGITR